MFFFAGGLGFVVGEHNSRSGRAQIKGRQTTKSDTWAARVRPVGKQTHLSAHAVKHMSAQRRGSSSSAHGCAHVHAQVCAEVRTEQPGTCLSTCPQSGSDGRAVFPIWRAARGQAGLLTFQRPWGCLTYEACISWQKDNWLWRQVAVGLMVVVRSVTRSSLTELK